MGISVRTDDSKTSQNKFKVSRVATSVPGKTALPLIKTACAPGTASLCGLNVSLLQEKLGIFVVHGIVSNANFS